MNLHTFFEIKKYDSSLRQEISAGLTVFLTMFSVIIIHPQILSQTGMPFSACAAAGILVCALSSLAMGLFANNPIALGPSVSLGSFFTFTLVNGQGIAWPAALGAVFWTGLIFCIFSLFRVREKLTTAIPLSIKKALLAGIGFFIALIGLKEGGILHVNTESEDFFIHIKQGEADLLENSIFLFGLILVFFLLRLKIKTAFIYSILFTSFLYYFFSPEKAFLYKDLITNKNIFTLPDMSLIGQLDLTASLKYAFLPVLLSMALVDLFESLSCFLSIQSSPPFEGQKRGEKNIKKSLLVDAGATALSGFLGSSPALCFMESLTGIKQGGKTGLTAVTTGLLFLPFLFLSPWLNIIPHTATAPVLIALSYFMIRAGLRDINWRKMEEAVPALAMMIITPLCFSIALGLVWGILIYIFLQILLGQAKKISFYTYILSFFCLLFLFL